MPSSCPRSDAASSLDFRVEVIEIILISIYIYIHTYIHKGHTPVLRAPASFWKHSLAEPFLPFREQTA